MAAAVDRDLGHWEEPEKETNKRGRKPSRAFVLNKAGDAT
jgi:hypothetical protein